MGRVVRFKRLDFDDVEAQIRAALPDGWKIVKRPNDCTCGGHRNADEWLLRYKLEERVIPSTFEISVCRCVGGWVARDVTRVFKVEPFDGRFRNIGDAVEASTRYVGCEYGLGGRS